METKAGSPHHGHDTHCSDRHEGQLTEAEQCTLSDLCSIGALWLINIDWRACKVDEPFKDGMHGGSLHKNKDKGELGREG